MRFEDLASVRIPCGGVACRSVGVRAIILCSHYLCSLSIDNSTIFVL